MRHWRWVVFLVTLTCVACRSHFAASCERPATPEQIAAVTKDVQAFTQTVAQDITRDGPTAWRKHFADIPVFFMAADGHLAFANGAAASAGIQDLTNIIKQIELRWGDDMRIDPLAADLAVVATSWHEVIVGTSGKRMEESGFFTGTVEFRAGRWQFRNAHWSTAGNAPALP